MGNLRAIAQLPVFCVLKLFCVFYAILEIANVDHMNDDDQIFLYDINENLHDDMAN